MNIQPLFDVKERLEHCAIAGTNLIQEDFRLKRAAEALLPLGKANPVFGKITAGLGQLMAAPEHERGGMLLEVLALIDAVAYTQGAVGCEGEWEPLPIAKGGYGPARYSQIKPLLDALTTTGSGRYEVLENAVKEASPLLGDYRVLPALVEDLNDSYGDMAGLVQRALCLCGERALPFLMEGFDPQGKRDMARRVQIIDEVAGAKADGFYFEYLSQSAKEVRCALIYALRHNAGHTDLLLDLAKTEKGGCGKAAHRALAGLDSPRAWEYWRSMLQKKPAQAAEYLAASTSAQAGSLLAEALFERLTPACETGGALTVKQGAEIQSLLLSLPGKAGEAVCSFFRYAAGLKKQFDRPLQGESANWDLSCAFTAGQRSGAVKRPFSHAVMEVLHRSLQINPDPGLAALAEELCAQYGALYFCPAFVAKLAARPSDECYNWAVGYLSKRPPKERASLAACAMHALRWDEARRAYVFQSELYDPAGEARLSFTTPLAHPLEERWYDWIMQQSSFDLDAILFLLLQPDSPALCGKLGPYFYRRCLEQTEAGRIYSYFFPMKRCGWNRCKGLGVHYFSKVSNLSRWTLYSVLPLLPGDRRARLREAQAVLAGIREKRIRCSDPVASVEAVVQSLFEKEDESSNK